MNHILHIDTSTKICSIALSTNGELIDYTSYEGDGFVHSELLTSFIESILHKNQLTPKDISAISVASGPGSYTGLRIGVSSAKGLCYALNIPLIAIDSLFSIASWAKQNEPNFKGNFCAMIDARRMEVFSAIFSNDLKLLKPISADILDENSYSEFTSKENLLLAGDGTEKTKSIWENRENILFSAYLSDARGQINEAYKRFLEKQFEDVAYFEPYYLKDFILGTKK
ncbi:MAG: tRNA (adenosine(37)-N6)-threonylcarbamoyltransferase complex dimerization subunit type 1 TsaB [Crocinitomicaceae bacterium]